MLAIVLLIAVCGGEEVLGGRIARDVFYKYPVKEYHPAEVVKYYVRPQVPQQYYYKDVPEHYHAGKRVEGYYLDDGLKKSVHDAEQSSLHAVEGTEGDHKLVVDTVGKHDYDHGAIATKAEGEGKVALEKLKGYEKSKKDGYDGRDRGGYQKGHKTSGFHRTYHNEESGKEHTYVDEDHKAGEHKFDSSHDDHAAEAGHEGYAMADSGADYKHWAAGRSGEGSGLRSAAAHHGRKGSYAGRDEIYNDDLAAAYHRGGRGGHHFGNYEPIY